MAYILPLFKPTIFCTFLSSTSSFFPFFIFLVFWFLFPYFPQKTLAYKVGGGGSKCTVYGTGTVHNCVSPGRSEQPFKKKRERTKRKVKPKCEKCDTAHLPGEPCRFLLRGQKEPPLPDAKWGSRRDVVAAAVARKKQKRTEALQSRSAAMAASATRKIRTLPSELYHDPWKLGKDEKKAADGASDGAAASSRPKIREEGYS
jgi:hypothetical protein